ncbi:unnamed protein product [Rotaria sp. Silwood2]|nr:unnamed protein product [Rotaria sp. Silwood2]
MVTRCLFGLFVFGTNSSVIYRFLTDDLYEYLRQCFKTRGYKLNEDLTEDNQVNNNNDDELTLSIDDAMSQHLSVLIRVHEQTSSRHDPIRQIKLQSGIQVFFDQWENSVVCSNLYELIRYLDSHTAHGLFPYNKLSPQVKSVENSAAVRRYFEHVGHPSHILTDILNKAYALHKSSTKTNVNNDERHRNGLRILRYLTEMSRLSTDAFRHLFFDSDEYARRSGIDTDKDKESDVQMDGIGLSETKLRKNEYDTSPMTKILRKKIILRLQDWFSFIEVKSQRNITMNFCHNEFPGLVHFVFVDRLRGKICTPTLIIDDYQRQALTNTHINEFEYILEKKILAFELECLSELQHGFTSYTMSDEHFTYSYTLRLQESNKLTVFMAYAPRYIIKECVQTCTSTNGMWGGSSIEVNCCASSLCNNASGLYFQYAWKNRFLFTIISSLFMTLLSII